MNTKRTPLVVCIDVEPDELRPDASDPQPWLGFAAAGEWLTPIREVLESSIGEAVHFGWFLRMDHQIEVAYGSAGWVADHYSTILARLTDAGDELGLHPHAWRQTDSEDWAVDLHDAAWVAQVTADSFNTYERAFGRQCRAHRFGDRHISDALVDLISRLGATVDVTAEPGFVGLAERRLPAHLQGVPRWSGLANRRSTLVAGASGELAMIPLAAVDPDPLLPAWRRLARRVRYARRPRHRPLLLVDAISARDFWDLLKHELDTGGLDVVAFAVRSSTFATNDAAAISDKLRGLAVHPLRERIRLATPSEAAAFVRQRAIASAE